MCVCVCVSSLAWRKLAPPLGGTRNTPETAKRLIAQLGRVLSRRLARDPRARARGDSWRSREAAVLDSAPARPTQHITIGRIDTGAAKVDDDIPVCVFVTLSSLRVPLLPC